MSDLIALLDPGRLSAVGLAGIALFVILHVVWYIRPSRVRSRDELAAVLYNGKPTIIEFYSNF